MLLYACVCAYMPFCVCMHVWTDRGHCCAEASVGRAAATPESVGQWGQLPGVGRPVQHRCSCGAAHFERQWTEGRGGGSDGGGGHSSLRRQVQAATGGHQVGWAAAAFPGHRAAEAGVSVIPTCGLLQWCEQKDCSRVYPCVACFSDVSRGIVLEYTRVWPVLVMWAEGLL